jgi:hypothetical protein
MSAIRVKIMVMAEVPVSRFSTVTSSMLDPPSRISYRPAGISLSFTMKLNGTFTTTAVAAVATLPASKNTARLTPSIAPKCFLIAFSFLASALCVPPCR